MLALFGCPYHDYIVDGYSASAPDCDRFAHTIGLHHLFVAARGMCVFAAGTGSGLCLRAGAHGSVF